PRAGRAVPAARAATGASRAVRPRAWGRRRAAPAAAPGEEASPAVLPVGVTTAEAAARARTPVGGSRRTEVVRSSPRSLCRALLVAAGGAGEEPERPRLSLPHRHGDGAERGLRGHDTRLGPTQDVTASPQGHRRLAALGQVPD